MERWGVYRIMNIYCITGLYIIPGLDIWLGWLKIRFGGSLPEENYPGTVYSFWGIGLVLPG